MMSLITRLSQTARRLLGLSRENSYRVLVGSIPKPPYGDEARIMAHYHALAETVEEISFNHWRGHSVKAESVYREGRGKDIYLVFKIDRAYKEQTLYYLILQAYFYLFQNHDIHQEKHDLHERIAEIQRNRKTRLTKNRESQ